MSINIGIERKMEYLSEKYGIEVDQALTYYHLSLKYRKRYSPQGMGAEELISWLIQWDQERVKVRRLKKWQE